MEVNGRKVKMSIWVRPPLSSSLDGSFCPGKGVYTRRLRLPLPAFAFSCRIRRVKNAFAPSRRRTTAARKASYSVRMSVPFSITPFPLPQRAPRPPAFPPLFATRLINGLGRSLLRYSRLSLIRERCYARRACSCACVWDANIVYDVSSRESFEALPRWLDELENYVPAEVVKIVVGNKLDKVK